MQHPFRKKTPEKTRKNYRLIKGVEMFKRKLTTRKLSDMIWFEFGISDPDTDEEFIYNNAVTDIIRYIRKLDKINIKIDNKQL